jgi:hypothetical protein
MRPEKAKNIVRRAFKQYRKTGLRSVFKQHEVVAALTQLYARELKQEGEFGDYRTGDETYGYDNEESISNNLMYISDRWNCSFRLRWLLDLKE